MPTPLDTKSAMESVSFFSDEFQQGPAFLSNVYGPIAYRQAEWSAANARIAMVLSEDSGNIWMMSRPNQP